MNGREYERPNLPIWRCEYLVKVAPTLLTKVLFWTRLLVLDSDTTTMLPDLANVALYEEACQVVGEVTRSWDFIVNGVLDARLGVLLARRREAGIVFETTDAANRLIVFGDGHVIYRVVPVYIFFNLVSLSAFSPSRLLRIFDRRCDAGSPRLRGQ